MATGNMEFLQWDRHAVARWIESIGFPQYKACFTENYITGRKLIYVNCASLPRLGVTHFKDMQVVSACVRELLGITEVLWSRSIADPRRDTRGLFLERKGRTGVQADNLTWQQFLDDMSQTEREREPDLNHNRKGVQRNPRHVSVGSRHRASVHNDSDGTVTQWVTQRKL